MQVMKTKKNDHMGTCSTSEKNSRLSYYKIKTVTSGNNNLIIKIKIIKVSV